MAEKNVPKRDGSGKGVRANKGRGGCSETKLIGQGLIVGGMGLSVGAGAIESLPASAAKTGVQSGLGTVGGFFPTMVTISAAGIVTNQLKKLKESTKKRR